MRRKRVETKIEERKIIINLHNRCKNLSNISRILSRPRSTVQSIMNRCGQRNRLQYNSRSGCPRKFNSVLDELLLE